MRVIPKQKGLFLTIMELTISDLAEKRLKVWRKNNIFDFTNFSGGISGIKVKEQQYFQKNKKFEKI